MSTALLDVASIDDDADIQLLAYFVAAMFSIVFCLFVLLSYFSVPALRHHPSPLLLWRTIFDILFALSFVALFIVSRIDRTKLFFEDVEGVIEGGTACRWLGPWFQFCVLGSQSWYFMMTIDLAIALLYPFSDLKSKVKYYHFYVLFTSAGSVAIISGFQAFDWRIAYKVCWIKKMNDNLSANIYTWTLFFIPIFFYYFASILVTCYAAVKFKKGLRDSAKIRKQFVSEGIWYNVAFCLYWTVAAVFYGYTYSAPDGRLVLFLSFAAIIGGLGLVDAIVWFFTHRKIFKKLFRGQKIGNRERSEEPINKALRKEVLYYTTTGMVESMREARQKTMPERVPRRGNRFYAKNLNKGSDTGSPGVCSLNLVSRHNQKEMVPFLDYSPQVFRYLRAIFGISTKSYEISIGGDRARMLEKYKQGRSDAFIYFTADSRYIVKTLEKAEAELLLKILPDYAYHMQKYQHSLINRFVGLHRIKMYHTTVYFVVMESIFLTNKRIHEKYDIKGSWVDRHTEDSRARMRKKGFQSGVMKDSDLHKTLLLAPIMRREFLNQVEIDSTFLRDLGIMDYSLLVGIRYIRQHRIQHPDPQHSLDSPLVQAYPREMSASHSHSTVPTTNLSINESDSIVIGNMHPITSTSLPGELDDRDDRDSDEQEWKEGDYLVGNEARANHPIPGEDVGEESLSSAQTGQNYSSGNVRSVGRSSGSDREGESKYAQKREHTSTVRSGPDQKKRRSKTEPTFTWPRRFENSGSEKSLKLDVANSRSREKLDVELQCYSEQQAGVQSRNDVISITSSIPHQNDLSESLLDKSEKSSQPTTKSPRQNIFIAVQSDPSSSVLMRQTSRYHFEDGGVLAEAIEGPGTYYFGIIDILQVYNLSKRLERFFKIFCLRKDPDGISVINEKAYQKRFVRNIREITEGITSLHRSVDYNSEPRKRSMADHQYFEEKCERQ